MNDAKPKILIVDDERFNINILVDILKHDDYKTIVAKNGEEALRRAVSADPPDLILLDIMMPGMDGYEVCTRLKSDEKTANIPVIFVTAMSEVEDETRGLELGAIDYITKPLSPPIVKARVKNHLSLKLAREKIENQKRELEVQNMQLTEAANLREDVERITRHDLKNPLNAIIGFSEVLLMKKDNFTEAESEYIRIIRDSGYQMLTMINRSLDIFKMERGIYQFNPDSVNILGVIKKIINEIQDIALKKDLNADVLLNGKAPDDADVFPVWGEELLCYSMLSNLIKNAFESSPQGEQIAIALSEAEGNALIRIHNKGSIPENIRNCFFEKYSTAGKTGGTGLGTYSAKLIAEAHSGSIAFDTSEENGTTLVVSLPRP